MKRHNGPLLRKKFNDYFKTLSAEEISALDFSSLKNEIDEIGTEPIRNITTFIEEAKNSDIYEMSGILMERCEFKEHIGSRHPELRDSE